MKKANIICKFEVVINEIVYEYDNLSEAEKKMRSAYKSQSERNLFRKEIKNGEVQQIFLLE
jgi:hypothetical protein